MVDYLEIHGGGLVLTTLFWDCECDADYIHPAAIESCPRCNSIREEQPDSHANEVLSLRPEFLNTDQRLAFIQTLEDTAHLRVSGYWNFP